MGIALWLFLGVLGLLATLERRAAQCRAWRPLFWGVVTSCCLMGMVPLIQNSIPIALIGIVMASCLDNFIQVQVKLRKFSSRATRRLRGSPEACGTAQRIRDIVKRVNKGKGVTVGIKQLIWALRSRTQDHQKDVLSALSMLSPVDLNYTLAQVNCPQMFLVCGLAVQELLASPGNRLRDLSPLSRSVLIDAFLKLGLKYQTKRQELVASIILDTHGFNLTLLKNYLDDGQSAHNTRTLLFHGLQGYHRELVLQHVTREGNMLRHQSGFNQENGVVLKVLSDFDDTISCSGAKPKFAGCDSRLPKGTLYPGAFSLFYELDKFFHAKRCEHESGQYQEVASCENQAGSNFVLLSARPKSYKSFSEQVLYYTVLKPFIAKGLLISDPVLLMGSLDSIPRAILRFLAGKSSLPAWQTLKLAVFETLALRKALCFEEYSACYPEAMFIFFGDDGQGDVFFAEMVNLDKSTTASFMATFVHEVRGIVGTDSNLRILDVSKKKPVVGPKSISLHRTHVGMALKAHAMDLLDDEGLKRVILSAVYDFREIKARYMTPDGSNECLSDYAMDLVGDVQEAISSLGDSNQIDKKILKHLQV